MENDNLQRELVLFSYNASDNENYIKGVYYESETDKAVQFTNQTSEKLFWMPKTMVKQGWKEDLKMPQNIKINYYSKSFRDLRKLIESYPQADTSFRSLKFKYSIKY